MTFVCIVLYMALLVDVNRRFSLGPKFSMIELKASMFCVSVLARRMSKIPYAVGAFWAGLDS